MTNEAVTSAGSDALTRDRSRAVFGLTLGCLALGAYIGRAMGGGAGMFGDGRD